MADSAVYQVLVFSLNVCSMALFVDELVQSRNSDKQLQPEYIIMDLSRGARRPEIRMLRILSYSNRFELDLLDAGTVKWQWMDVSFYARFVTSSSPILVFQRF